MIDLETFSTRSNAAIVSIGAVKFEDDQILDKFYCTIDAAT
jgi:DNA polymerase III epsilon subunit-like protein